MKFRRSTLIAMAALCLLPILATAALYARLPSEIPIHWSIDGSVDYSSKAHIWLLTMLAPFVGMLLVVSAKIDPQKRSYAKFANAYESFCIVMTAFLGVLVGVTLSESFFPGRIGVSRLVPAMCGGLFLFIGNMMPKFKHNYFIGVKTPWTLADPLIWNRANRLAGYLFFASGLLILLSALTLSEKATFIVTLCSIAAAALIPGVLSYFWHRRAHPNESNEKGE